MRMDEFIVYLDGVKPNGRGYTALCPAHNDRSPSLSISETVDGTMLLKCHAGCETPDVVQVLGLEMQDLFPDDAGNGRPRSKTTPKVVPGPEPIDADVVSALHAVLTPQARDYLKRERVMSDEAIDGYQLGLEERNGEKRITIPIRDAQGVVRDIRRWLAPEHRREGSPKMLHWGKGYGAPRLYPIDQLEYDDLVFTEGELDALALIAHGIPAITLTAGADTSPDRTTSQRFRGKLVTFAPDNDEAGSRGALKRAHALAEFAREIRIASWKDR
jgi:DNA primase